MQPATQLKKKQRLEARAASLCLDCCARPARLIGGRTGSTCEQCAARQRERARVRRSQARTAREQLVITSRVRDLAREPHGRALIEAALGETYDEYAAARDAQLELTRRRRTSARARFDAGFSRLPAELQAQLIAQAEEPIMPGSFPLDHASPLFNQRLLQLFSAHHDASADRT